MFACLEWNLAPSCHETARTYMIVTRLATQISICSFVLKVLPIFLIENCWRQLGKSRKLCSSQFDYTLRLRNIHFEVNASNDSLICRLLCSLSKYFNTQSWFFFLMARDPVAHLFWHLLVATQASFCWLDP